MIRLCSDSTSCDVTPEALVGRQFLEIADQVRYTDLSTGQLGLALSGLTVGFVIVSHHLRSKFMIIRHIGR